LLCSALHVSLTSSLFGPDIFLSTHPQHTQTNSNSFTIVADSNNCVTNTRCCRYSCLCSWWWVVVPCRAVSRYKLCNVASCWIYIRILLRCTNP
jgi:hypothetical protein